MPNLFVVYVVVIFCIKQMQAFPIPAETIKRVQACILNMEAIASNYQNDMLEETIYALHRIRSQLSSEALARDIAQGHSNIPMGTMNDAMDVVNVTLQHPDLKFKISVSHELVSVIDDRIVTGLDNTDLPGAAVGFLDVVTKIHNFVMKCPEPISSADPTLIAARSLVGIAKNSIGGIKGTNTNLAASWTAIERILSDVISGDLSNIDLKKHIKVSDLLVLTLRTFLHDNVCGTAAAVILLNAARKCFAFEKKTWPSMKIQIKAALSVVTDVKDLIINNDESDTVAPGAVIPIANATTTIMITLISLESPECTIPTNYEFRIDLIASLLRIIINHLKEHATYERSAIELLGGARTLLNSEESHTWTSRVAPIQAARYVLMATYIIINSLMANAAGWKAFANDLNSMVQQLNDPIQYAHIKPIIGAISKRIADVKLND